MAAVNNINKNFLSPLGYKFSLARAPALVYNVQAVRIPGIQMSNSETPTPFVPIPTTGKITYNTLGLTFRINEDMTDYLEIHNWMKKLAGANDFVGYKQLSDAVGGANETLESDLNVTIMNSGMRGNISIDFFNAFPVVLGDLDFNTTDTDVNYIECSVEFRYLRYEINTL